MYQGSIWKVGEKKGILPWLRAIAHDVTLVHLLPLWVSGPLIFILSAPVLNYVVRTTHAFDAAVMTRAFVYDDPGL